MLLLKREQRMLLADTLRDLANLAVGAMVFGHLLADHAFSPWLAALGLAGWVGLVVGAVRLAGRSNP